MHTDSFTVNDSKVLNSELFWANRISTLQPIEVPFMKRTTSLSVSESATLQFSIQDKVSICWSSDNESKKTIDRRDQTTDKYYFLISAFASYLARLNDVDSFDIGFQPISFIKDLNRFDGFYAPYVPLRVNMDAADTFMKFREIMQEEIDQCISNARFAPDIASRYPEPEDEPDAHPYTHLQVVVAQVETLADYQTILNPGLIFLIPQEESEYQWIYNPQILDAAYARQMMNRFVIFLLGISSHPDYPIWKLPLLSEQEFAQQIIEWNDTKADFPAKDCYQYIFEAQVKQTPDAVAVRYEDTSLSYEELNRKANQVAHYLKKLGVGPDVLVGLCLDRSMEMAIGLLGILKAGGAYLPVDVKYPFERISFMLNDSQISLILSKKQVASSLPKHNARVVLLDADRDKIGDESEENPAHQFTSENLAYVIYTSGSTGRPKGVLITHRGMVNFSIAVSKKYGIQPEDQVLQFFSISFDGAVEEIFATWLSGATLVFHPGDMVTSIEDFTQWVKQECVTVIDLPTAFWHEWVNGMANLGLPLPPDLRVVIVGGEKANASIYSTWQKLSKGDIHWFNTYGPTETTVVSTIYESESSPQTKKTDSDLPIGRPISNTLIYMVDKYLQPVPVGVTGEMLIGGAGVARGYHNRPDLTAEKFIPDPFCDTGRVYKTGDLVRYRPDGNIEFSGRVDNQVKIRGFRVEPEEIEAVIAKHPSVESTMVISWENRRKEKFLAAYIVPEQDKAHSPDELRSFIKERLPDYMIPATFVLLESLPLLSNGKVDRRALPKPHLTRKTPEKIFVAPRNKLERQLIKIWEKVLGFQPIGVRDNFFDLGGHSLLAVRLCIEIEKKIGKKLSLSSLFQALTVEKLAMDFQKKGWSTQFSSLVAIQTDGSKNPLFFIHVLGEGLKFIRPLVASLGPEQPVYGLSVHLMNGKLPVANRVEDMAAHYIKEIRTFQPEGPYMLAGISFGGIVAFEMARQLQTFHQNVSLLALLDTIAPGSIKTVSASRRFSEHWKQILTGGPLYILEKIKWHFKRFKRIIDIFIFRIRRVYVKFCEFTNRPMSPALKDFAARSANKDAGKAYQLKVYSGHVTLFRSTDRIIGVGAYLDPELGWGNLARGGLEIYDVPNTHLGMLEEPYVQVLAEKLNACIDKTLIDSLQQDDEIKGDLPSDKGWRRALKEKIELRVLKPGDGELLRDLSFRSLSESPDAFMATLAQVETAPKTYWTELENFFAFSPDDILFLAFERDRPCGYAAGRLDAQRRDTAHLRWLWVDPAFREEGVARLLLNSVIFWSRNQSAKQVELWVAESQTPAICLYKDAGFIDTDRRGPLRLSSTLQARMMVLDISTHD